MGKPKFDKKISQDKFRNICFTAYNYDVRKEVEEYKINIHHVDYYGPMPGDPDWQSPPTSFLPSILDNLMNVKCSSEGPVKFLVFQSEICPKTGKRHLQGYAEFKNQLRMSEIQKKLGIGKSHIEPRYSKSASDAIKYCEKADTFDAESNIRYKSGEPSSQGSICKLSTVAKDVLSGKSMREIARDNPVEYVRNFRGLFALQNSQIEQRGKSDTITCLPIILLYGDSGAGKSHYANHAHDEDIIFTPSISGSGKDVWFDKYEPDRHKVLLFEDYDGEISRTFFLRLLDKYRMTVPVKNSFVEYKPSYIYVTSNTLPHEWYPKATNDQIIALYRRFSYILKYTRSGIKNVYLDPVDITHSVRRQLKCPEVDDLVYEGSPKFVKAQFPMEIDGFPLVEDCPTYAIEQPVRETKVCEKIVEHVCETKLWLQSCEQKIAQFNCPLKCAERKCSQMRMRLMEYELRDLCAKYKAIS